MKTSINLAKRRTINLGINKERTGSWNLIDERKARKRTRNKFVIRKIKETRKW